MLTSCMDEIRNVVGESVSERQLVDTIMKFKFDFTKSLDAVLNNTPPSQPTIQLNKTPAASSSTTKEPIATGDTLKKSFFSFSH